MEGSVHEEIKMFQKHVADRFLELSSAGYDEMLSISWIKKLLDVFLCCQEEFRMLLFNNKSQLSKSPADRVVVDFFERVVKALDVCNAFRDGVEQINQWQKLVEIILLALDSQRSISEGHFRRAKKALADLAIGMFGEKQSNLAQRSKSFGPNNVDKTQRSLAYLRSISMSVSRSWSAAKQLQKLGSNLVPPRGGDIAASNGLVVAAYTRFCYS